MFKITGVGRLAGDPELRFTPSGDAVCEFTLAANRRVKNRQTGQWEDGEATFIRCVAWRYMAENIADTFVKGQEMIFEGDLRQENYETKQGEKRSILKATVTSAGPNLQFQTAQVAKSTSNGGGGRGGNGFGESDPWNSRPATGGGALAGDDEPPF